MQRGISALAIAGAWGYIGRKFVDAAEQLQLTTSVYDVGAVPSDLDAHRLTLFDDERAFYRQRANLFHLALHPEHRDLGFDILLERSLAEPICILCEKPMAVPESPSDCNAVIQAIGRSGAIVLYDFPELFDPITARILAFFHRHDDVRIESIVTQRSKDREDPAIARNEKRMVHIQYQESVHCLAFALYLLAHIHDGLEGVFADGLQVAAKAWPYQPPNPSAYPYVVDGKCEYRLLLGETQVDGKTDFTRGAPWSKRRTIKGHADGRPFLIEADYLEDKKLLMIDGKPHDDVVRTNSYVEVLKSIDRLRQSNSATEIMTGLYPNPAFARVTYQASSLLWKSSWEKATIELGSFQDLLAFDAGFAAAKAGFQKYDT